jgi:hypothetical protein
MVDATFYLETVLMSIFGNLGYAAIAFLFLFIIIFIIIGLNARFAILATMPLGLAFTASNWLDSWVAGLYWMVIIGFSLYTLWTLLQSEYF